MRRVQFVMSTSVILASLAGCTASPEVDPAPPLTTPSGSASGDEQWPDGASPKSPRCQAVSVPALQSVNDTIVSAPEGWATHVDSLQAHPDPELALWVLTGSLSVGNGAVTPVAWGTTADPTIGTFSGVIRSIGDAAATVSSAPAISLDAGDNLDGSGIPLTGC